MLSLLSKLVSIVTTDAMHTIDIERVLTARVRSVRRRTRYKKGSSGNSHHKTVANYHVTKAGYINQN